MIKDVILHGDVYTCLDYLDDSSVAVAITSPPYWKQRDYKFKGQIGQEKTPEEYIGRLVKVYSKLRQKLRNDGIFFLNVGDKISKPIWEIASFTNPIQISIPYGKGWLVSGGYSYLV
jgi:DNA modification methylase